VTEEYLKKLDSDIHIYEYPVHISNFGKTEEEIIEALEELKFRGLDMSGNVRTIFTAAGSSIVSLTMAAAWAGITGDLPEILNLIKRGEYVYGPSPEKPVVSLQNFRNRCRQLFRKPLIRKL
jgi:hypothetical protein